MEIAIDRYCHLQYHHLEYGDVFAERGVPDVLYVKTGQADSVRIGSGEPYMFNANDDVLKVSKLTVRFE